MKCIGKDSPGVFINRHPVICLTLKPFSSRDVPGSSALSSSQVPLWMHIYSHASEKMPRIIFRSRNWHNVRGSNTETWQASIIKWITFFLLSHSAKLTTTLRKRMQPEKDSVLSSTGSSASKYYFNLQPVFLTVRMWERRLFYYLSVRKFLIFCTSVKKRKSADVGVRSEKDRLQAADQTT